MTEPVEKEVDEKDKYEGLRSRFLSLRERKKWHVPLSSIKRLPVPTGEKLTSQYPKVESHWLYELNSPYKPDDFSPQSNYLAWWRCSKGPDHVYEQAIKDHVQSIAQGSVDEGCPFCAGLLASVTNTLFSLFPGIAAQWNADRNGPGLDVLATSPKLVWWRCSEVSDHQWQLSTAARVERQSGCPHCKKESVNLRVHPLVMKHFDKKCNPGLDPSKLPVDAIVSWKCGLAKDHVWQSAFYITKETWCPYCRKRKPMAPSKLNSRKGLMREFDRTKNDVNPKVIDTKSQLKLWWKCEVASDHVWQASVYSRAQNGSGCPFCSGHRVAFDKSLAGLYPEVAKDFHSTKNAPLTPDLVVAQSRMKVWWAGECGHEWQQKVVERTTKKLGCIFCLKEK